MRRAGLLRTIVIIGGILVLVQALIHSFLGYPKVTAATPKQTADVLLWAWFAVGIALASFGIMAVYVAFLLVWAKRWAMIVEAAIGATTLLILVPAVFIGIGFPVIGIIGGLLLLTPVIWVGE